MWIGIVLMIFAFCVGRGALNDERSRQTIALVASSFCILMGPAIISIAIAVAREEHGYGTLTGGPHGARMLVLTIATGLAGVLLLIFGAYLFLSRRRRVV